MIGGFRAQAAFFLLFTASLAVRADVIETKILKIPAAFAQNYREDNGTPVEQLISGGQAQEILRLTSQEYIHDLDFYVRNEPYDAGSSERWNGIAQGYFHPGPPWMLGHTSQLHPPWKKGPSYLDFATIIHPAADQWQTIWESSFEDQVLLAVAKFTPADDRHLPPKPASKLVFECYWIPASPEEAQAMASLAGAELERRIQQSVAEQDHPDWIRGMILSGQLAIHLKGPQQQTSWGDGSATRDAIANQHTNGVRLNLMATTSPDLKWVHLVCRSRFATASAPITSLASDFEVESTLSVGSWKAFPATTHDDEGSAVMAVRIKNLPLSDLRSEKSQPQWPAPAEGAVSRIYSDIHPSILSDLITPELTLSPKMEAQRNTAQSIFGPKTGNRVGVSSIRDLLIANGVPDGKWTADMIESSIRISNADDEAHRMIKAILANYTWEKITTEAAAN